MGGFFTSGKVPNFLEHTTINVVMVLLRKILSYGCSFVLIKCLFFMLGFSEGFVSHVSLPFFFLISGNAPLITCFVLRSKIIFNNFTFFLMYYSNFVFKIVAKTLLFPLLLRNLKVI